MNKPKLINTVVFAALLFLSLPAKTYAIRTINYYSNGSLVNAITCGDNYTFDIPDYSNKTIWLRKIKNEVILSDGQYKISTVPTFSQCNLDEGVYTAMAYSFDTDPSTNLTTIGNLIATGTLTIKAKAPVPNIIISNITNSGRSREFWTEDYIKIKLKGQFSNQNQPVELCRLRSNETVCNFVSNFTNPVDGSWEFIYQVPATSVLGKSEQWLKINGVESNHFLHSVVAKPTDPSLTTTCYLIQSRPHADVWLGDKVTWTVLSRPSGYRAYWYGGKNNVADADGLPTGHSSNSEWLSEAYLPDAVGNYSRWVQFRDKKNNYVCNSNVIAFSVINPPANLSLTVKSPVSSVSAKTVSLFGNLLANLLKFLKR